MKTRPLDYAASGRTRLPWWVAMGVGIALALVLFSSVPVRRVQLRIDPVTGSMSRRTVWPFGIASRLTVTPSPLALRLKQIGVQRNPTWQFLSESEYTLWGRPLSVRCATAPPIYQIRPVLQDFVAASTDEELRRFAQVLHSGRPDEQQAAIDAAAEKGLARLQGQP
jgi:hypothetical protein